MKCSNCGREIKKEERFCPYCGSENKKTKKKNKWLTGVMGLIVVCIIFGIAAGAMNSNKKEDAKKDTASNTEKATEKQTTAASTKTAVSTETASTKQTKNNTQAADDQQDETENSEYILPESDTRYVDQDEIDQLTKNEVRLAINEIYARHGRIFENSELREYFESKDWYDGTIEPEDFDEDVLNQYEKANVKLLADNK
ncbi:MAG: YARHG domain-containing protein [Anaerostipes hadrus]|nr:YARHG domain-containing protein [Anaerostipes hadrus]